MPNYVRNVMTLSGNKHDISEILAKCKTDESEFDFNGIIPMPGYIYRGNLGLEERLKYGDLNWYDWSYEHWGTKWNACDPKVEHSDMVCDGTNEARITFDTAWSAPIPVFEALAKQYPDLSIVVNYADEDYGSNCGIWNNGVCFHYPYGGAAESFAEYVWSM